MNGLDANGVVRTTPIPSAQCPSPHDDGGGLYLRFSKSWHLGFLLVDESIVSHLSEKVDKSVARFDFYIPTVI